MEKIKIGKIVNVIGLKGELKVYSYSGKPENFKEYKKIIIDNEVYDVNQFRIQKSAAILKLSGIDDRNAAEALKNKEISITEKDLKKLPEGQYYIRDIIGLDVFDQSNKKIGIIKDVISNSSQNIFVIGLEDNREFMLPFVKEFVKDINFRKGAVSVNIIEGIMECSR